MNNYILDDDEVILFNAVVSRDDFKGSLDLMLTSKRILFKEKKKSIFKSKTDNIEPSDEVMLSTIKMFNDKYQINQKGSDIFIQTTVKNFTITFDGTIEAMKFVTKITDALTGKTISERGTEKVKNAFNKVDDVLGFNTRDTIKGVIENGAIGTIFKGIKKDKK